MEYAVRKYSGEKVGFLGVGGEPTSQDSVRESLLSPS